MPESPTRRATLDDLARAAGVSRTTASNAYNRPDQLSTALRERVLAAAERIGYAGPNPLASRLASGRADTIAFLLDARLSSAFSDPALSITLDAFATELAPDGFGLLLLPGGVAGGPEGERMPRVQADVAVAYSLPDDAPAVAASRQRGLPVVAIDGPEAAGAALVRSADRAGAEAAARYVTSLGHRRIGILMTPGVTASPGGPLAARDVASSRYRVDRERMTGYLDALREAGISEQGLPVWEAAGVSQYDAGPSARALLTAHPEVTALLCTSDELAIGALEAARALGIAVPQALSIVGYDDTPGARHANPPLTTVHQDLIAKGTLAARLARDVLAGRSPAAPEPVGVELVVRGTTAPPVER